MIFPLTERLEVHIKIENTKCFQRVALRNWFRAFISGQENKKQNMGNILSLWKYSLFLCNSISTMCN